MNRLCWLALIPFAVQFAESGELSPAASIKTVATYSIVACDPETGELGVAVQSRFLAVGAVVPWAKAGVGAVATQAFANTTHGPAALDLLAKGETPENVSKVLLDKDDNRELRQMGIVNVKGESNTSTGTKCNAWAGGVCGKNYAIQGNILAGEAVIKAMEKAFLETKGELGGRLLEALTAGQAAGGDTRGMQSAALLIVHEGWGYAGLNDRFRDLRVDDNSDPIKELKRLYALHCETFPRPDKN